MSKSLGKTPYIAALLLIFCGVGALFFTGISEDSAYFLNVAEAHAMTPDKLKDARLFGTVAENMLARSADGHTTTFLLEDKDTPATTMPVLYSGVTPDTFKAGAEVIIEGSLAGDGVFHAKTIMTKCPSKYKKENRKS